MNWYLDVLKNKYAVFTGRARRTEYWMFFLFNLLIAIGIAIIEAIIGTGGILGVVFSLAMLIPGVAVTVRRLHDTGRSGWWVLISLLPVIGWIVLLVFMLLDSEPSSNSFGPSPKAAAA